MSYKVAMNSMRGKKTLKEKSKINFHNNKNILQNKSKVYDKISKTSSSTSRAFIKAPFEVINKSVNKKKSK